MSTYERLVNSQNFFSPYLTQEELSRFGRDYIETGRYLERWLPEHGVRFIAVTDNIDSARGAYDMMMPLKNLFNTQYARDISQKVKSSLHAKQQRGEFIGAEPSA